MPVTEQQGAKRTGPGRPREFDVEAALDRAIQVFRERGYHAASIGDLCAAMRLTTGSLYKAFPDKRAIFLAAFNRYIDLRHARLQPGLDAEHNGFDKIRALLRYYAETSYGSEGKQGCLVVGSAAELSTLDAVAAARVNAALRQMETLLRGLIRLGQADGSVPARIDAQATARTLLCILQGMRVIGKAGRIRVEILSTVEPALQLLV
jgi:TetR/AcrR family transcriptional repressor of nem operon